LPVFTRFMPKNCTGLLNSRVYTRENRAIQAKYLHKLPLKGVERPIRASKSEQGNEFHQLQSVPGRGADQPAKTNSKRDQPVNPIQTGFPSFFNSDVIDDEIKNYREKLKQENQILFSKNDNSIEFGQTVEVGL